MLYDPPTINEDNGDTIMTMLNDYGTLSLEAQVLHEARAILDDPDRWVQTYLTRNAYGEGCEYLASDACAWCLVGAIQQAGQDLVNLGPDPDDREVSGALYNATMAAQDIADDYIVAAGYQNAAAFNDAEGRTHAEVLSMMDALLDTF